MGWKFPPLGGNFIECHNIQDGMRFNFSFYKDFDLYADSHNHVVISNDPRYQGTLLDNDIIGLDINDDNYRLHRMDWKPYLDAARTSDRPSVIAALRDRLWHNLEICADVSLSPVKIVYTGGLDSSLLAFLFHDSGKSFQCIMDLRWQKLGDGLPFSHISYRESSRRPDRWACQNNIKTSFYGSEMTDCITGFFGDIAMLHNNDLYHQCRDLMDSPVEELYDLSTPADYPKFSRREQAYISITKIMRTARFQQWFEDFRILDPYRDPALTLIMRDLPWKDLSWQFGSAWVQKEMIKQLDPNFLPLILEHKNQYTIHQ